MPRQNRITPFGEIVAVPERGTMMGNRGILHNSEGRIRRRWQVKRWLLIVIGIEHRIEISPSAVEKGTDRHGGSLGSVPLVPPPC